MALVIQWIPGFERLHSCLVDHHEALWTHSFNPLGWILTFHLAPSSGQSSLCLVLGWWPNTKTGLLITTAYFSILTLAYTCHTVFQNTPVALLTHRHHCCFAFFGQYIFRWQHYYFKLKVYALHSKVAIFQIYQVLTVNLVTSVRDKKLCQLLVAPLLHKISNWSAVKMTIVFL